MKITAYLSANLRISPRKSPKLSFPSSTDLPPSSTVLLPFADLFRRVLLLLLALLQGIAVVQLLVKAIGRLCRLTPRKVTSLVIISSSSPHCPLIVPSLP